MEQNEAIILLVYLGARVEYLLKSKPDGTLKSFSCLQCLCNLGTARAFTAFQLPVSVSGFDICLLSSTCILSTSPAKLLVMSWTLSCPSRVHCSLTDLCTHDHHSVTVCSVPGINPKALHLILMTILAYWWWPQEQMRKLRPGKAKITHWSSQSQKATGSAFDPRHVQLQITATSSFLSCPPDKFPPTLQVSDQM